MKKSGFFILGVVIVLVGVVLYFFNKTEINLPEKLRRYYY